MAKQFFKDLPDTTTPLTATRLNGLLDGEEALGNIVVDSIRSKNIFDGKNFVAGNRTGSDTSTRVSSRQVLYLEPGTYTLSTNLDTTNYKYGIQMTTTPPPLSNFGALWDSGYKTLGSYTFTIDDSKKGYFNLLVAKSDGTSTLTVDNVKAFNWQIDKGSTATNYAPYQELNSDNFKTEEIVVGSVRTKNMFDKSTLVQGDIVSQNPTIRLSSRQILWLNAGTYTFSNTISNSYDFNIVTQHVGIPPFTSQPTFDYNSGWKNENSLTFTINTAGWFTVYLRKHDNSAFTSTDLTNLKRYNYQLETGSTATNYMPYQNLDNEEIYSSEEVKIGTFLGKPLYRKVVNFGALPNAGDKGVTHNISNLKTIISINAVAKNPTSQTYFNIPSPSTSALANSMTIYCTSTEVHIVAGSDRTNLTECYVILEYTKTTD